jgi:hypothetical protein
MDSSTLTLIQTIFGLIQTLVVVITLFILINEYRKLRKETKVSNYTKQVELLKELRLFRINNPSLSNAYTTELTDTSKENTQYHFFNLIVLSTFELTYINYKENIIDKKTWGFWFDSLKVICKEKTFREMMNIEHHKIANPDFLKLVEKIIEEQINEEQINNASW